MKHSLLFLIISTAWISPASAEIYKYVDANGHVTYSSTPTKGAIKLNLETAPAQSTSKQNPNPTNRMTNSSPQDFPKVDGNTQKSRDDARRHILQAEMATEAHLLNEVSRRIQHEHNRNPGKIGPDVRKLQDEKIRHEKNIDALRMELSRIR